MSASVRFKAFTSVRHFGVEMEVNEELPREVMGSIIQKIDPGRECHVTGWTMTGGAGGLPGSCWSVKTDSTCASFLGNHGHEVASFKASGAEDIKLIGRVAAGLKKAGAKINNKCGVHVHADVGDWSPDQVGVMLARWCKVENIVAQALPLHRRTNQYARLMRRKHRLDYNRAWSGEELYAAMRPTNLEVHHNREKRVAINLVGYATGQILDHNYSRKTAELRLPEGTVERYDVENWARFYVHFIEECSGKPMPDLKPVGLDETLTILGLQGTEEDYCILSPELHETKVWFLKRLLKHSTDTVLFREVIDRLNRVVEPIEKYVEVPHVEDPVPTAA